MKTLKTQIEQNNHNWIDEKDCFNSGFNKGYELAKKEFKEFIKNIPIIMQEIHDEEDALDDKHTPYICMAFNEAIRRINIASGLFELKEYSEKRVKNGN